MKSFTMIFSILPLLILEVSTEKHIAKRSDDQLPLEAVVQQLANKLSEIEAQVVRDQSRIASLEQKVSFRVDFSQSVVTPPPGPLKFDHIVINDGNGYDATLGIFTAPVNGLYIFGFQFYTENGSHKPQVDIKVNGNLIARMTGVTTAETQSDMTVATAKLSRGDRVWVEGTSTAAGEGIFWGPGHTFFFGALLYTI